MPVAILREHNESTDIRATPIEHLSPSKQAALKTTPAPLPSNWRAKNVKRGKSSQRARTGATVEIVDSDWNNDVSDLDNDGEELAGKGDYSEEEWKKVLKSLTSEDISKLRDAIFESRQAADGKTPLQCDGLSKPPSPGKIADRFLTVLGDPFHACQRTIVGVKHEVKKTYVASLMNVFLVWNPEKEKQLEDNMKEAGILETEIKKPIVLQPQDLHRLC